MLFIKQLCLIVYVIITVLFTVGYATQPIVSDYSTNLGFTTSGISPEALVSGDFYLNYMDNLVNDLTGVYTTNTDYTNLDNNKTLVFRTLYYLCIVTSILLVLSIILGFFGLKLVSKVIFLIVLIMMIITFVVIQITIIVRSIAKNVKDGITANPTLNNGAGYYLIMVACILMFFNYIIYALLG